MIKIICVLIAVVVGAHVAQGMVLSTPTYAVIDMETGEILVSRSLDEPVYPASLTKLLTAWVVVHHSQLHEYVTITKEAENVIGTRTYFLAGEIYTVEELLHALLLPSANDAAIALAIHISGNVGDFALLMNDAAKEMGATGSSFINPHGLHDGRHYTTARDFALIARTALLHPTIRDICSLTRKRISNPAEPHDRLLVTTNKMLDPTSHYHCPVVVAGKTGYTSKAGHTLAVLAQDRGQHRLLVSFGGNIGHILNDAQVLLTHALNNYNTVHVTTKGEILGAIEVVNGQMPVLLAAAETVKVVFDERLSRGQLWFRMDVQEVITPLEQGQRVGTSKVFIDDTLIAEVALVVAFPVEMMSAYGRHQYRVFLVAGLIGGSYLVYLLTRRRRRGHIIYDE